MSDIEWKEPPAAGSPATRPLPRETEAVAELKANPGQWALLGAYSAGNTAFHIKSGKRSWAKPAGSFEATCRTRDDGKFDIYVRYVGGEDA